MTTQHDQLAELLRVVQQYDNEEITEPQSAPTGTDYNRLYGLVTGYLERVTAPLPLAAPKQEPRTPTLYECDECDWTGTLSEINGIHHIHHISEYLEPGELVPAGCCPECNAVIGVDDRDVPHYTLNIVGNIMRARGWSVAAPADRPSPTTKGA